MSLSSTKSSAAAVAAPLSSSHVSIEPLEERRLLSAPGQLVGGVDPYNMGKGDWIWKVDAAETKTRTPTVPQLMTYLKNKGFKWIIVKAGNANDGPVSGSWGTNFNPALIT